jgi:phage shock protein C
MKRDTENGMIAGVCAGLAKELEMDVTLVRLIAVGSFFLTGSVTFWLYVIAAIAMPKE